MTDNKETGIESSFLLRAMIESVPRARHVCHQRAASYKQRRRILALLQPCTDIPQHRKIIKQPLYLLTPVLQQLLYLRRRLNIRICTPLSYNLSEWHPRYFLNGCLHSLTGVRLRGVFFLLLELLGSTFHRLRHILIACIDDFLHPRLSLHNGLHTLLVAIEHDEQICGEFKTLGMSVAVSLTRQLISIPCINNLLYIIPPPLYTLNIEH